MEEIKEIELPTKKTQDEIKTKVDNVNTNVTSVKTDVATVKSNVATVNTNVNTVNTNLGAPTSSASSSTSGNAHAKLNFLMNSVAQTAVLKQYKSGYSSTLIPDKLLGLGVFSETSSTLYFNVYGKGRLLGMLPDNRYGQTTIRIDGSLIYSVGGSGGWVNLPFSSRIEVHAPDGYSPNLILYELIS